MSLVRLRREALGLTQVALAARVGVTRQTLSAIEAGSASPGVGLALALGRALGTTVEALFDDPAPRATTATPARDLREGDRVWVGRVHGRDVAHALGSSTDRSSGTVARLGASSVEVTAHGESRLRKIFLAGCAQAIGILAAWARDTQLDVAWIPANNDDAKRLLAERLVHGAVIHAVADEASARTARNATLGRVELVRFGSWEAGLVVAQSRTTTTLRDALARPSRLALRERGSGAARLFEGLRRRARAATPAAARTARSHDEAADLVLRGDVDAALANRTAAHVRGLGFVPLARERVDLLLDHEAFEEDAASKLTATLRLRGLARDIAMTGHDSSELGISEGWVTLQ
ncbi:MAG TPA: substrate-binding domain-containing protein [Labilithrix sp.]|jgi:molybdate-binding protein/DNA-binding XRE family transcriptional regulator|nr:substrate-binding domain-containing protein [Labilithrix sp.]